MPEQKINRKTWVGLLITVIASAAIGSLLAILNPLEKIQLQVSSFLYTERKSDHPIVIVGIDQHSTSELGRQADWSRDYYAQAIENLQKYNPRVIGLDLFFGAESFSLNSSDLKEILNKENASEEIEKIINTNNSPADIRLGEAIRKYGVIMYASTEDNYGNGSTEEKIKRFAPTSLPKEIFRPINKNDIGINYTKISADQSIRKYFPLILNTEFYPSFAWAIAAKYQGAESVEIENYSSMEVSGRLDGSEFSIPMEDFQMLINYRSKLSQLTASGENFHYISFLDIYRDQLTVEDSDKLKNAIVLIGLASRNQDSFRVPIESNIQMPGVMIHGQAIQTILDQAWLRNCSVPGQIVTVIILAILSALLVFGLRLRLALPAIILLFLLYIWGYAPMMFQRAGIIVNLVYPLLTVIVATIFGYAYRFVTESEMKKTIVGILKVFTNEEVGKKALEKGTDSLALTGEKRHISVIFTDIKGFTTISETLQPQSLVALLNEYFEVMSAVIVRNGGIVDKYEGDAIMAFFEEKEGQDSHQCRAAQAALDMRAELPKLLDRWKKDPFLPGGEKKPEIDFRVGISSGEAVVGNIGSKEHIQYTAIGDIVNLGSRLESANKQYQTHIMMAESTFEAIKAKYDCRFLDFVRVKGKKAPLKTYELLGPTGHLDAEKVELIRAYNQGVQWFFDKKFAEAADFFRKNVLSRWPDDFLSSLYADRSENYLKNPPGDDWDGVYEMESK